MWRSRAATSELGGRPGLTARCRDGVALACCFGGGFEIALRADVIIAAESAQFCHTEAAIGMFTLLGGVQRVAERAGRGRATRWALTSERIPAADALAAGIVTEVVPDEELE